MAKKDKKTNNDIQNTMQKTIYMYKSTMNADNSSLLFTQIYNLTEKL
jgi:hypothetical protein